MNLAKDLYTRSMTVGQSYYFADLTKAMKTKCFKEKLGFPPGHCS